MKLNDITNEYITLVSKTMYSKVKESPVVGPRTLVEPTNGFPSTAEGRHGWSGFLDHGDSSTEYSNESDVDGGGSDEGQLELHQDV